MKYIKELIVFIQNTTQDSRIPVADKKILLILVALILSPIDLIPDWIPLLGQLDDALMLAIILDYFFNHLDQNILLSHYPWGMKSFIGIKKSAKIITFFAPQWIKKKIWSYKPEIY